MARSVELQHLADLPDVWDNICANLSGDELYRLTQTPDVRAATLLSPAFVMLAGCDFDGNVMPWRDTANSLSPMGVKRFSPSRATLRSKRAYRGAAAFFDMAPVGCGPYK
jgi:hypothetical protein